MKIRSCAMLVISWVMFMGAPTLAQTEGGQFDLLVRGIKAASVSYSANQNGTVYGVTGRVQTTGLAAVIKRLRYDGAASGTVVKGRLRPDSYRESADTGRRQSEATLAYEGGVPEVTAYSAANDAVPGDVDPGDVDPATMGGSVDPLTAFYATMGSVDAGRECNLSLTLFDGKRASQVQIGAPVAAGDGVTCDGSYIRVKGFTAKEMAKQTRFSFSLIYSPTMAGRMRVVEARSQSIYGKVTLKRR